MKIGQVKPALPALVAAPTGWSHAPIPHRTIPDKRTQALIRKNFADAAPFVVDLRGVRSLSGAEDEEAEGFRRK